MTRWWICQGDKKVSRGSKLFKKPDFLEMVSCKLFRKFANCHHLTDAIFFEQKKSKKKSRFISKLDWQSCNYPNFYFILRRKTFFKLGLKIKHSIEIIWTIGALADDHPQKLRQAFLVIHNWLLFYSLTKASNAALYILVQV